MIKHNGTCKKMVACWLRPNHSEISSKDWKGSPIMVWSGMHSPNPKPFNNLIICNYSSGTCKSSMIDSDGSAS